MNEAPGLQRSLGISASDMVAAYQHVAGSVLKETGGDRTKIFQAILRRLSNDGTITEKDVVDLSAFYDFIEKSDGNADRRTKVAARNLYVRMLADPEASNSACVLAELYQSMINGTVSRGPNLQGQAVTVRLAVNPWVSGAIDAAIGLELGAALSGGSPIGAGIGAVIGFCVGACGESDPDN